MSFRVCSWERKIDGWGKAIVIFRGFDERGMSAVFNIPDTPELVKELAGFRKGTFIVRQYQDSSLRDLSCIQILD